MGSSVPAQGARVLWHSIIIYAYYYLYPILLLYSILLFDVRILNVALYVSRRGMYACVRRWAIYVRPRGV